MAQRKIKINNNTHPIERLKTGFYSISELTLADIIYIRGVLKIVELEIKAYSQREKRLAKERDRQLSSMTDKERGIHEAFKDALQNPLPWKSRNATRSL